MCEKGIPAMSTRPLDGKAERARLDRRRQSVRETDEQTGVSLHGCRYRVDFGPRNAPRYHLVNKNRECSCGAKDCAAIEAVRRYLLAGGPRAPDPEETPACPICGGKTYRDRVWDGKYTRTFGWRCARGGLAHFLSAKAQKIRLQMAANPWLIPPTDGYPGVRRDEIMTWEDCQAEKPASDPEDYTI